MNGEIGPRLARKWLMERVERTSARRVAEELELDMPVLPEELCAEGLNLRLASRAGGPEMELIGEFVGDEVATLSRIFA